MKSFTQHLREAVLSKTRVAKGARMFPGYTVVDMDVEGAI
jgi:hypothetical protein